MYSHKIAIWQIFPPYSHVREKNVKSILIHIIDESVQFHEGIIIDIDRFYHLKLNLIVGYPPIN